MGRQDHTGQEPTELPVVKVRKGLQLEGTAGTDGRACGVWYPEEGPVLWAGQAPVGRGRCAMQVQEAFKPGQAIVGYAPREIMSGAVRGVGRSRQRKEAGPGGDD